MGVEIVRDLSRTHRVIATGRRASALEELATETGCDTLVAEVTDEEAFAAAIAGLSRLDVLVHTAAIGDHLSVGDATRADWDAQLTTNVVGPALITRVALPLIREAEGTIIFIGSGAGTKAVPGSAIYSASKHALRAVADVLRIDEEPHRVRVVTLAPGQTDTPMLRNHSKPGSYTPERYIKPSTVAATVRFVIDAPADTQITDIAVRPRQEIARI
ncbi:SDR family oxidoreductase [Leucobacter denitrificans]|uniref:SDR family oxidoreductase n=2 Tax=Leucobacter denitrificans TaxID=683042 RepID=A0A7G9S3G8_9MICO|nr:SDR family oxidoreductase [Leucobacter denitrificans]QNN62393.1 SDR family oxidoreductase [Leucobacter denitrificans]